MLDYLTSAKIEQTAAQGKFYSLYHGYDLSKYIFLINEQRRVLQLEKLIILKLQTQGD